MHKLSSQVASKLHSHPLFKSAKKVLLYNALWDEVDVLDGYVFNKKQVIILPSVIGEELELHRYGNGTPTHVGAFGITESLGELENDYASIDLAIIPGRAFTKEGKRLGRGKGYYDRLLPLLHCKTIGVCFPFQILDDIPTELHDCKVDEVITINEE